MKRLSFVVVALALLLAGCKVDTTVTIDVRDDGSGTVTVEARLDPTAVQAVASTGTELEDAVRLSDVTKAGWKTTPWQRGDDGSASISMSKDFTSPDQVAGIVGEINGVNGPLRDVQATRDRGLLATDSSVTGAIDLGAIATGVLADPELVGSLTNQQVDVNALDASLLQQVRDSLSVQVVVNLPGGASTTIRGVSGERVAIDASTSVRDTRRIVLLVVAVVLVVLAVAVWFGGRHSRYRHRSRQPIPRFDPHSQRS